MRVYMAVTAHYLARSDAANRPLLLCSELIGFLPIPGQHFAQELAKSLLYVTDCAGISNKVIIII